MSEVEAWMPVGEVAVTLYVGANDDGFRWGTENVIEAMIEVPEPPPLEWALTAISEAQEIRYWSDGSANVVFETTMENVGSELVSGELAIVVECSKSEDVLEDCGGEYTVELDPREGANEALHTVKVPGGTTSLSFSHGDEAALTTVARVPARILGVDRDVWECFADTSNLGKEMPRDVGVGCGGWSEEYIAKWPVGESIKVWTTGDDDYEAIFGRVLADVGPLLNLEFEDVPGKLGADILVYLGLPRDETRIDELRCNHAAGCARFDIGSDGSIRKAWLVVWTPGADDDVSLEHQIYSIALHELIHVLAGMLHRHHDRTSVMSYDALDYLTLGEEDMELLRIASHPLVEPGMRFSEVRQLVIFTDELIDPPESEEPTLREVLRRVHANLMDAGSAKFEISGGWPECNRMFDSSQYSIGDLRPSGSVWVHLSNDDDGLDLYMIKARSPLEGIEYWLKKREGWVLISGREAQRLLSFRDSLSNPLGMLGSINIYDDGSGLKVISESEGYMTLQVSLDGADVRTEWSPNKQLDVELEIDVESYEISGYKLDWSFEPEEGGVCDSYRVVATDGEYGGGFEIPDVVRQQSALVD